MKVPWQVTAFHLTSANGGKSVALGGGAQSTGQSSVALGAFNSDGGLANVVSIGASLRGRRLINVVAGTGTTDAFGARPHQLDVQPR